MTDVGADVVLSGWMSARRDFGPLVFLHLRDFYGMTQVVVEPSELPTAAAEQLERIYLESVIRVSGTVRRRPEGQENPRLSTGDVEVVARDIEFLSAVHEPPPFLIEKGEASDESRLRYRYLDLRRPEMRDVLVGRSRLSQSIRKHFAEAGFVEVHTPVLANSSPEGARDFLVPSRLHPGQFYALPQAPQQWKQLLMASGVDRYYQIAPCFRDEAARADRSPGEFYQLDVEMAFVEQEDVLTTIETLLTSVGRELSDREIVTPWPRLTHAEALERYASDKPDLRFELEALTLTEPLRATSVTFLAEAIERGESVRGLVVPGGASMSRRQVDELRALAQESGVRGLAWIAWSGGERRGSIANALPENEADDLRDRVGAEDGSLLLLCAGPRDRIDVALSAIRHEVGDRLGLADPNRLVFAWITDFPMYERNPDTGAIEFSHNPFSMPQGGLEALNTKDPLEVVGQLYDIVCNGYEVASGAVRNADPDTLYRAFEIAGYDRSVVDTQFGHMIEAFRLGTPPHAGIAPGFERLLMLFMGQTSLRDVVPFPKNQRAQDLMVQAPSPVPDEVLDELGLAVVQREPV